MIKTKWMLIIRTEAYLRVFPTVPFGTPRVSSELRCSTGMSLTEALPWTRITFVMGNDDRGCGGHENGGGIMISVKLIIMKIMMIYDDTQLPTIAMHCSAPSCVWRLPRWPSWPHSSWCQTLPRGQHRHHHSHKGSLQIKPVEKFGLLSQLRGVGVAQSQILIQFFQGCFCCNMAGVPQSQPTKSPKIK